MIEEQTRIRAKSTPILEVAESLGLEVDSAKKTLCFNGHDSKTKSLSFDVKTNLFKCFGCGAGGDVISLVLSIRKCTFKEAINFILGADQYQSPHITLGTSIRTLKESVSIAKESGEVYSDIYSYFLDLLPFPDENHYLVKDRCLSLDVLKANNIKAIKKEETWTYRNRLLELITIDRLCKSGLLVPNKRNTDYHLCFWQCCGIIPFYNGNKICYLQGLTRPELRDKVGKSCNLKSVKKPCFYFPKGFDSYIRDYHISVCEGGIDALSSLSLGGQAVAYLDISSINQGQQLKEEINYLRDYEIIIIGDHDLTGLNAKVDLLLLLLKKHFKATSVNIKNVALGFHLQNFQGKDFNDLLIEVTKCQKH